MKQIKAFGFDQGASRDVGDLFLPEVAKTLPNGTCPGHHNGVVQALKGFWTIDGAVRENETDRDDSK